jgi:Subtilase family
VPVTSSVRRTVTTCAVLALASAWLALLAATPQAATAAGPAYNHAFQWPLNFLAADSLWRFGEGANVTVAVVDTGVDAGTADLKGATITRDGPAVHGGGQHGTEVAEIIAGQGVRGSGNAVVGLAPRASLIDIPVAPDGAAVTPGEIINGIKAAVKAHARIIDVSLGAQASTANWASEGLDTAVTSALGNNCQCVVVAGIDQGGQGLLFPADSNGVIAVAGLGPGMQPDGSLARHGPHAVYAPGAFGSAQSSNGFAAAYVSAAAAVIWSADPGLSVAGLEQYLLGDVTRTQGSPGGYGVIDPQAVLTSLLGRPYEMASPTARPTPSPSGASPAAAQQGPSSVPSPTPHQASPRSRAPGFGWTDLALIALGVVVIIAAYFAYLWWKTRPPGPGQPGPLGRHSPVDWPLDLR